MKGRACEYVYTELREVESCGDPANDGLVGSHVAAVRLNLGGDTPSGVLIFTLADMLRMRDDLDRVFREYGELTGGCG
jgi:hypothetical protein